MVTFPRKITFRSGGEVLERQDEIEVVQPKRLSYSQRGKVQPKVEKEVKLKSMKYKYVDAPIGHNGQISKKIGTFIDFDLQYLTRLEGFDCITHEL